MNAKAMLIRLIGFGLLAVALWRVPLDGIAAELGRADLGLALLAVALLVPFFICKSWRWQMLLRGLGVHVPLPRALALYFVGLFAGYASPGQVGETVKAVYLKRQGHSLRGGLASIALDRLADLALLVLVAALGLPLIAARAGLVVPTELPLLAASLALLAGALYLGRAGLLRRVAGRLGAARFTALARAAAALRAGLPALAGLTGLAYAFHYVRYYGLLRALDIPLALPDFVVVLTLASLVALLPISLMGIGTRDVALVGLFGLYGLPPETAIAFSALILVTYLANLAVGFTAWMVVGPRPS